MRTREVEKVEKKEKTSYYFFLSLSPPLTLSLSPSLPPSLPPHPCDLKISLTQEYAYASSLLGKKRDSRKKHPGIVPASAAPSASLRTTSTAKDVEAFIPATPITAIRASPIAEFTE